MSQESTAIFHRVLEALRAEMGACREEACHCPHVRRERHLAHIRDREAEQERRSPARVAPVYTLNTIPDSRLSLKE